MAYSVVPLVVRDDLWTAADHNTYIRNNFAATEVGIATTAGQIAYGTGNKAITNLNLTAGRLLKGGTTAPAWFAIGSGFNRLRTNLAKTDVEWTSFPPGEVAIRTNTLTVQPSTVTYVPFESASIGTYSMWSAVNPTRITIPSGYPKMTYKITGYAIVATGVKMHQINLILNGSGFVGSGATIFGDAQLQTYRIYFSIPMNLMAGEYIEMIAYHTNSAAVTFSSCRLGVVRHG